MANLNRDEIRSNFADAVNMDAAELEAWLETDESRRVGWKKDGQASESVGHASGRLILAILRKEEADLSGADYEHMRTVVGFVRRHKAQRPDNVFTSRWRYSLMNWGHDPIKEEKW